MSSQERSEKRRSIRIAHTDKIASILLFLLVIGIFSVSRSFTGGVTRALGPAFFPRVIAVGLGVLALIQFGTALRSDETGTIIVTQKAIRQVIIPVLSLVGYIALLPILGFFLTTIVFLISFMYYSGVRVYIAVPLAIIISVVLQNVFVGLLLVPLPTGTLPIRDWLSLTITTNWGMVS
jgi:putative tricarboxylic transport membrane protein